MNPWLKSAAALVVAAMTLAAAPAPKPQLMVLGLAHFDNPARDIANVKVEDVLTPARQREIEAVVESLARFHPNHVAVEWESTDQAALDKRYADYRAGRLKLTRDERDQIGLRLAARLGLPRVDAADWNQEPPGKDEDYDFPAWLKAHGREADWVALQADGQRFADAMAARNRCTTIGDWLHGLADPAYMLRLERPYYRIATFGDAKQNPGAAWVGAWHARNLHIYDNLLALAKPGDRIIAVFGAGHAWLLLRYASESGSFAVVDPRAYLPPVTPPTC